MVEIHSLRALFPNQINALLVMSQRDSLGPVVTTGTATATGQAAQATVISGQLKSSDWHLYVVDAPSGETLWRTKTTGKERCGECGVRLQSHCCPIFKRD